jgi:TetR/AcrR family transcriptional regulator, regulator of cefoperazone and chloramphenicol sensitivity
MEWSMSDADTTRQRLLDAAETIFAEKGYKAANIREICERAGANIAAVNYHFGGKEQLYVETVRHAYESMEQAAPMPDWPAEMPVEQRLRDFIRTFLSRLLLQPESACPMQLIMREVTEPTAACQEFVEGHVRPTFAMLMSILDPLLPANVGQSERNLVGGSIIGQCLHYHHSRWILPLLLGPREAASLDVERLADHITRFSLAALLGMYAAKAERKRP